MTASFIAPRLWVGPVPPYGEHVGKYFDRLLIVANEEACYTDMYPGVQTYHVPLQETCIGEENQAVQMGRVVAGWMRKDLNVLVACRRGLGRAALVGSIALLASGVPALEAMERVRAARGPLALDGPHFQRLLQRLEDTWSFQRPLVVA